MRITGPATLAVLEQEIGLTRRLLANVRGNGNSVDQAKDRRYVRSSVPRQGGLETDAFDRGGPHEDTLAVRLFL